LVCGRAAAISEKGVFYAFFSRINRTTYIPAISVSF
jgi:hypothetical protein